MEEEDLCGETLFLELNADEWEYLAEGNAHIIIAFCRAHPRHEGQASIQLHNKVIRIAKCDASSCTASSVSISMPKLSAELRHSKAFHRCVLSRVVPSRYSVPHQLIYLSQEFLAKVGERIDARRPASRKSKSLPRFPVVGQLEHNITYPRYHGYAMLCSNCPTVLDFDFNAQFTMNPPRPHNGLCFEIKVKNGFTTTSPFLLESHSIKSRVSHYRIAQLVKLHDIRSGKSTPWGAAFDTISAYDPLDVCSGSPERVQKALYALAQSPQNNFIVYNSKCERVYGLSNTSMDALLDICIAFVSRDRDFISNSLSRETKDMQISSNASIESPHCVEGTADCGCGEPSNMSIPIPVVEVLDAVARELCASDALQRLQLLQCLDLLDVEGAHRVYQRLVSLCIGNPCIGDPQQQADVLITKQLESIDLTEELFKAVLRRRCNTKQTLLEQTLPVVFPSSDISQHSSDTVVDCSHGLVGSKVPDVVYRLAELQSDFRWDRGPAVSDLHMPECFDVSEGDSCKSDSRRAAAIALVGNLTISDCTYLLSMWIIALGASDASLMLYLSAYDNPAIDSPGTYDGRAYFRSPTPRSYPTNPSGGSIPKLYSEVSLVDLGPKPVSKIRSKFKEHDVLIDKAIAEEKLRGSHVS